MDHPLSKSSLEALHGLVEKNFKEHYQPMPLDPPDVIAYKSRLKNKEVDKAAEDYKASMTRGLLVLIEIWNDTKKEGPLP